MKIDKISSIKFKSYENIGEKRFITPAAKQYTQKLLWEMNHQTQCRLNKDETEWVSNVLTGLSKSNENIKFTDNRFYHMPVDNPQENICDCTLTIGKTILDINSTTGEIVRYKKGFFSTWSNIYMRVEDSVKTLLENINNTEIVKKSYMPLRKYTPKGKKIAMEKIFTVK